MAKHFKPYFPFDVPMKLLIPTYETVKGVVKKNYPNADDAPLIFGSFRTFNGTETTVNDVYTVIDTGTIDTWYRPDIKADCRVMLCDTGDLYEVYTTPENIDRRNQFLQFRVRKVGGGA